MFMNFYLAGDFPPALFFIFSKISEDEHQDHQRHDNHKHPEQSFAAKTAAWRGPVAFFICFFRLFCLFFIRHSKNLKLYPTDRVLL
jgi:hypothetical protein